MFPDLSHSDFRLSAWFLGFQLSGFLDLPQYAVLGGKSTCRTVCRRMCRSIENVHLPDIEHVVADPLLQQRRLRDLTAEAVALRQSGDAGFHELTRVVGADDPGKLLVVLDEMRTGTADAHVSDEHV